MNSDPSDKKGNIKALVPLFVFLFLYLIISIIVQDFYKIPITVAFLISSIVAIGMTKGSIDNRMYLFSEGASNSNILLMIWIFILAGAFAQSAKEMGSIDAAVNLSLSILPNQFILGGIFLAACFVSLSIGTSVGTIVALTPLAVGMAEKTNIEIPFIVAIVIGGALFGDNLSFISDTTVASTKTQGCMMRDKFRVNSMIVLPAAIAVFIIYMFLGNNINENYEIPSIEWIKVIPYLIVLGSSLFGLNVIIVLFLGILSTGIIGIATSDFDLFGWFGSMSSGIINMGELIIITLLAGGMLKLIQYNGGIQYIMNRLTTHANNRKKAELTIATLVSIANLCTANNTIAIITIGPIAKDIAERFHIDPRKSASILDTFSCCVQGIIPYGAQVLMAAGLASISPIAILKYIYYPYLMGICALLAILFRYPKKYS